MPSIPTLPLQGTAMTLILRTTRINLGFCRGDQLRKGTTLNPLWQLVTGGSDRRE